MANNADAPMPLSEIESILSWVDTFKLSKPTKKINRDFSDAVLLAEILSIHYPKLVEMHNYPPRNSHSLKLNNWMTLNKKVLKKLKINICYNTLEQLAACTPGIIERVLVMVREKIRHDKDAAKPESEHNLSSGGSYYEASGNDDQVLVVPIKTRVNGVLETVQIKVVSHDCYLNVKQELDDAKATVDALKQKIDHLDNMCKIKDERLEELQSQLERRKSRRNINDFYQTHMAVQFDSPTPPPKAAPIPPKPDEAVIKPPTKIPSIRSLDSNKMIKPEEPKKVSSKPEITNLLSKTNLPGHITSKLNITEDAFKNNIEIKHEIGKIKTDIIKIKEINNIEKKHEVERIKSDIFKEIETEDKTDYFEDTEEFKDSEQVLVTNIENSINMEINAMLKNIVQDSNDTN